MSFDVKFPKTLISLQLMRDTLNVSRIFLHQIGDDYVPYRLFTMVLENHKVANVGLQKQRVWVAIPAIDNGNSDLFKMMNIFFQQKQINSLFLEGQMHDVLVPHYSTNWSNEYDNAYYQVTPAGVNFDSVMYNDMTNRALQDNKLIMATVIFPITVQPAVAFTAGQMGASIPNFKMPVMNKISTLAEIDFEGETISPSKPSGIHDVSGDRKVIRGAMKIGDEKAAHVVGEIYDTGSGRSRAAFIQSRGITKANMYAIGSLFPITSRDQTNLGCRFAVNITAFDFGGSSAAPELPVALELTMPAMPLMPEVPVLDLSAAPLPFNDGPASTAPVAEKSYM